MLATVAATVVAAAVVAAAIAVVNATSCTHKAAVGTVEAVVVTVSIR